MRISGNAENIFVLGMCVYKFYPGVGLYSDRPTLTRQLTLRLMIFSTYQDVRLCELISLGHVVFEQVDWLSPL